MRSGPAVYSLAFAYARHPIGPICLAVPAYVHWDLEGRSLSAGDVSGHCRAQPVDINTVAVRDGDLRERVMMQTVVSWGRKRRATESPDW